jgi:hypothetical protein
MVTITSRSCVATGSAHRLNGHRAADGVLVNHVLRLQAAQQQQQQYVAKLPHGWMQSTFLPAAFAKPSSQMRDEDASESSRVE